MALLCNECGQYQSRARRIWANMSLSGLVSLVPIITLAIAFLNTQVFFPHSNVKASVIRCETGAAVIALSNSGTRPAVLRGGSIIAQTTGKLSMTRTIQAVGENNFIFLKEGDARVERLVFISPADNIPLPIPVDEGSATYRITLDVIAFDQTEQHIELSCIYKKS